MSLRSKPKDVPSDRLQQVLQAGADLKSLALTVPEPAPTEIWARDGMQKKLWDYMKAEGQEKLIKDWTAAYLGKMDSEKLGDKWRGWDKEDWTRRSAYPTPKQAKASLRETGFIDKNAIVHVVRIAFLPGDWRLAVALDLTKSKATATLEFSMGLLGWKGWSHKFEGSDQDVGFNATTYEDFKKEIPRLMKEVVEHNYEYLEKRKKELEK